MIIILNHLYPKIKIFDVSSVIIDCKINILHYNTSKELFLCLFYICWYTFFKNFKIIIKKNKIKNCFYNS